MTNSGTLDEADEVTKLAETGLVERTNFAKRPDEAVTKFAPRGAASEPSPWATDERLTLFHKAVLLRVAGERSQ